MVWYLESNNILTEYQSGFRKHRSTADQLVRLESYIREAFVRREHAVSVFFDLEKAYDTTPRGSTAYCAICMTLDFVVVCPSS